MIKVLIVDDELLVRTGIKSLISWNDNGFEMVGEAKDGVEALELFRTYSPDIVITDIVMPNMDGIELIESIKKINSNTKIIVLSCHSDFEHVKKALKKGAEDYLLKLSMKPNELLSLLNEIKKNIYKADSKEENSSALNIIKSSHDLILEKELFAVIFKIDFIGNSIGDDKKRAIVNYIEQSLIPKYTFVLSSESDEFISALINLNDNNLSEDLKELISNIKRLFNISLSIGISSKHSNKQSEIAKSEAEEALGLSYYLGSGTFTEYGSELQNKKTVKVLSEEISGKLKEEIGLCNYSHSSNIINNVFEMIYHEKSPEIERTQIILDLLHIFKEVFDTYNLDFNNITKEHGGIFAKSMKFEFFDQLKNWFNTFTKSYCETLSNELDKIYSNDIKNALSYIHSNYNKEINLETISKHLGLSEAYFSTKFKKETGVNFVSYLNSIRLEKAKELLYGTNMPTYLIAQSVGFENENYFSRLFKKIIGVPPTNYRKNRMNKKNKYKNSEEDKENREDFDNIDKKNTI